MRLRSTIVCATLFGALALVPAASAKGTAYVVGGNAAGEAAPFSIAAGGELTALTKAPAGGTPRSVAITPNSQFLYASFLGAGNPGISGYSISQAGTLTPLAGVSPLLLGAGNAPEGLAISPNGQVLYVAQQGSNSIAALAIGADGGLTPIGTTPVAGFGQGSIAVAPNGQLLYATTAAGVVSFTIGANGGLSAAGGPFPAGTGPRGIAIAPNGNSLYVSNNGSNNVTAFSVGADGALTSLGNSPTGITPATVAVSQNGAFVYITAPGSDNVSAYAIGADGALTAVPGQPFSAAPGDETFGLDAAPGSQFVYATNRVTANTTAFSVGADGALSQIAGSPFPTGVVNPEFQSIAITPNQGPTALFTGGVVGRSDRGGGGQTAEFNASSSSDSDGGSIAAYTWDFGDGSAPETTASPTISHTYTAAGDFQVTLTVTDDQGCSNQQLFTGQTADCNGSGSARMTQTVQVSATDTAPNLKLKGKKQELAKKVTVTAKTTDDTDAVAKGKLRIEKKSGKSQSYKLKKAKKSLVGGEKTKIKPKLRKKAYNKAKKVLKNGGKVTAKVNVKVTDADDDTDKDSVKVKLTKP
ncbi:MAG TPA: beta-propeller fold lactonase family protein [Solirubrobacterales bacterium]